MIIDDWHNLYSSGWGKEIVKEAYSHPAKYSRLLIAHLYQHAIDEGWVKAGDTVLDPFGGVALGGLDAMKHGLTWIGCELEERFCLLGRENIALWNKRYSVMPGWGTATLLQGDSRHLIEVIQKADLNVSSPPYVNTIREQAESSTERDIQHLIKIKRDPNSPGALPARNYGQSPGQLGGMLEGDYQLSVSSPPFLQQSGGTNVTSETGPLSDPRLIKRHSAGNAASNAYGEDPANLGNMPQGDLILSSPPYAETRISGNGDEGSSGLRNEDGSFVRGSEGWEKRKELGARYGNSDGNLGNLKDNGLNLSLSSPPYSSVMGAHREGTETENDHFDHAYGNSEGNLGNLKDCGLSVSSPPFSEPNNQPCIGQGVRSDLEAIGKNPTARYGSSEGNLGNMDMGVSSPPFEGVVATQDPNFLTPGEQGKRNPSKSNMPNYGETPENIGNQSGNDFWSAARIIVEQVYQVLKPGGHSIWVVKSYIKAGKVIDFPGQWQKLCESVGFQTVHIHRAWLVEEKGTQYDLFGEAHTKKIARKSFFRRLAERKGSPAIDYEVVLCMQKGYTRP